MESFLNGTVMIEAGLLSVLLALWITWLALRGLFHGCALSLQPAMKTAAGANVATRRVSLAARSRESNLRIPSA